jgi:protease IV
VDFAKSAWRILVAIKDGLALILLLIFFGALYAVLSSSPNPNATRDGALMLSLSGSIVEQQESLDPMAALTGALPAAGQVLLRDVVHALETAAKDDDVKVVVLDLDSFWGGGQASLTRIGEALDSVRKANKPVLAFASAYSDDAYLLAAHANEVWLDPMGGALFAGPGGSRPYFKGLIDKLGVNARVYRVGKFKSFVEPYTLSQQSPEARAADQALAGALWSQWQESVSKARPKAKLADYINKPAEIFAANGNDMSKAAMASGIVDKLGDKTAFAKRVALIVGKEDDDPADTYNGTLMEDYLAANPQSESGEKIGIITVAGEIVDGEAASGMAGGDTVSTLILDAIAEDELKALVVRIDSPGGSALASEKIRSAIAEAKAKGLPVIASMGDVAASGGYWVAMGADKVYAEPATVTGSIGVFGIIPTFENTLAKAGVTADGITTTPLSGQPDILRGTSEDADKVIQGGVESTYARFLALVSSNRKMPVDRVNEVAQGRVWDGGSARQLGLIDAFGSLDEAIAEAARRAKIDADDIARVYLEPESAGLLDVLAGVIGVRAQSSQPRDIYSQLIALQQADMATGLRDGVQVLTGPAIQVRCLGCPRPAAPMQSQSSFKALLNRVLQ